MKSLFIFISIYALFLFPGALVIAQESVDLKEVKYDLLAPLPFVTETGIETSPYTYIKGILVLAIGIAGALAVIMIIIGGFKYVSAEGFGQKSGAKENIQNALLGLLLAIGSYSILYTLNDKLVNFELSLETQPIGPDIPVDLGEGDNPFTSTSTPPGPGQTSWPSDVVTGERARLTSGGVSVNRPGNPCVRIGQLACTSVSGIGDTVINGLIALKADCNCMILVTGGTEYWLHGNNPPNSNINSTLHRPGGNAVDLSKGSSLGMWFAANPSKATKTTESGCATGSTKYRYGGALYVLEEKNGVPDHWHVCF